jgi:hypothetical protein
MAPPPGERWVVVDIERRVAAEVFFRKGHMPLDWRKRDSMMATIVLRLQCVCEKGKKKKAEKLRNRERMSTSY